MTTCLPALGRALTASALVLLGLLTASSLRAELPAPAPGVISPEATSNVRANARVLMLGTFHFDNPGLDAVRHDVLDVMGEDAQADLETLAERLAAFKPDVVLLEYNPDNDVGVNERYRRYLAGEHQLERNEIYQIGFRVAKRAGLASVASFDELNTPSDGDLWNYMPEHAPDAMKRFEQWIEAMSAEGQRDHRSLSLLALLQKHNQPEQDRRNKEVYLSLNAVGAKAKSFNGADSNASWWRRNFRMYANIQRHANRGARILVIGGQGHTAILRDFMAIDSRVDEEPIAPFLALRPR